jgi:FAD/FMN-containing dehydrogenase
VVDVKLSGWGRYPVSESEVIVPRSLSEVLENLSGASASPLIARGLGRSYGDSSLASRVLSTEALDHFLNFDDDKGLLTCSAGLSLAEVLAVIVPRGWFLPVTPGTKYVTVGGAIASDVHGKNHHLDGSFSDHVLSMQVATVSAGVVECSHSENPELFRATAGGMGLTGIILQATFSLRAIAGAGIRETTYKARNLQEALELFEQHQHASYSVAWFDAVSSGQSLGRSLLTIGEHENNAETRQRPSRQLSIPVDLPGVILNRYSIRAFNALYYHRIRHSGRQCCSHYDKFFYPLDGIGNWNRLYGRAGFVQYQFVLPVEAGLEGLGAVMARIAASGRGSFLAVLKSFGEGNDNYLSFPRRGYTVALDFKLDRGLMTLLDELDIMVLGFGGRLYLAKDARMSEQTFKRSYPQWEQFMTVRERYDANRLFHSVQSERLGL